MKLDFYSFLPALLLCFSSTLLSSDFVIIPKEYKHHSENLAPGVYEVAHRDKDNLVWILKNGSQYVVSPRFYLNTTSELNGLKSGGLVILERELRKHQFPYFVFPGLKRVSAIGIEGTLVLADETGNGTDLFIAKPKEYVEVVSEWNRIKAGDLVHIERVQEMFWSPRLKVPPGDWPIEAIGANGDVILRNSVEAVDLLVTRENYKVVNPRHWESDANAEKVRLYVKFERKNEIIPVIAIRAEGKDIGVVRAWQFRDALKFRNSLKVYKIDDSLLLNMASFEDYQKAIEMDKSSTLGMPGTELQNIIFPPDLVKTPSALLEFVNSQFKKDPPCIREFSSTAP